MRKMARNRKYQSAVIRFGPALKAFLLCLLIGGAGVGYVWQKNQIYQLGQQIRKREIRLAELEEQNEKLKRQWAMMRSPQFLEMRIKELNLGLTAPQPSQVWRINEPGPDTAKPGHESQYAQGAEAGISP
jgi:TolA-binding protein